jgi:ParB-like chromosome segregation protein Spo0J
MRGADLIVPRSTTALIPYVGNSRTHSPEQVQQIAGSIREFGFTNPVLIDQDNGIIAGHGRVLAAQLLGLSEVPCIVLSHLSPAQRRAYVIADNKLALNAGWDEKMLALELDELKAGGFDLDLTGFGEVERADLELRLNDPAPSGGNDAPPDAEPMELRWGNTRLPITATEKLALTGRLDQHLKDFGAPYGFVREGLGLGAE